jgi:hypothetical protein
VQLHSSVPAATDFDARASGYRRGSETPGRCEHVLVGTERAEDLVEGRMVGGVDVDVLVPQG